jgi:hypothetical protein
LHPDILLSQLTAEQWEEWLAFYRISPFDGLRADIAAAQIALQIANRNLGKREQPYKLKDFLPFYEDNTSIEDKLIRTLGKPGG